jgi:hypothetical protein
MDFCERPFFNYERCLSLLLRAFFYFLVAAPLLSTSLCPFEFSPRQKLKIGQKRRKFQVSMELSHPGDAPNNRYTHISRNTQFLAFVSAIPVRNRRRAQQLGNAAERHRGSSSVHLEIADEYVRGGLVYPRLLSLLKCCARPCRPLSRFLSPPSSVHAN